MSLSGRERVTRSTAESVWSRLGCLRARLIKPILVGRIRVSTRGRVATVSGCCGGSLRGISPPGVPVRGISGAVGGLVIPFKAGA